MYSCIQKAIDDRGKFFIIEALQKSRLLHRRQLFGGNLFPSEKPGGLTGIGAPEGGFHNTILSGKINLQFRVNLLQFRGLYAIIILQWEQFTQKGEKR